MMMMMMMMMPEVRSMGPTAAV